MSNRQQLRQWAWQQRQANLTAQQAVDKYNALHSENFTRGWVCRLWREYKQEHAIDKVITIPRAEVVTRPANEATDKEAYHARLQKLLADNDYVRVMHMNDLHLPYHDERAVTLFFELAKRFQPDVVVVGSDAFDYPTISRYESDYDISVDDWLVRTQDYWQPIISQLRAIVPDAILPFIFGNHDRRALDAIGKSSAPKTLLNSYRDTITTGGVLWLGKTEVVKVGALTVAHGKRFNKYTAAYTAQDFGFTPVNVGHTHRPQMQLSAVVNGMLCQSVAHYDDRGYPTTHKHGTSLITIHTASDTVNQVPITFEETDINELWCAYGDEILISDRAIASKEQAA